MTLDYPSGPRVIHHVSFQEGDKTMRVRGRTLRVEAEVREEDPLMLCRCRKGPEAKECGPRKARKRMTRQNLQKERNLGDALLLVQ